MTLVFIPFQSGLVFKLNTVSLVVFDIKITVITPCYEFIVTFYFIGNESDGCTSSEKKDETRDLQTSLEMIAEKFCVEW